MSKVITNTPKSVIEAGWFSRKKRLMCAWAYSPGADLGGRVRRVRTPPPPSEMPCGFLILYGILQNMQICLICILSSSHYVNAKSKAFFFVFTFKICLRQQSVTPFLSGSSPPVVDPGGEGGGPPCPYFKIKLRPEVGHRPPPTHLSKGLNNRAPLISRTGSGTGLLRKILDPPM